MLIAAILYTAFSRLGKRSVFNTDKLLHRGQYAVAADHQATGGTAVAQVWNWRTALGITNDFTKGDKIIYAITLVKSIFFFVLWIGMTIYALGVDLSDSGWGTYHLYVFWFYIITSFIIAVWLSVGGLRDLFRLFHDLRIAKRDFSDDGTVRDHDYALEADKAQDKTAS